MSDVKLLSDFQSVVDLYSKESKGKRMTFIVMETVFKNDAGAPVVTERFNLIHRK